MFLRAMGRSPSSLPLGPSPWQTTRVSDPNRARLELVRDANGALMAALQLDQMQPRMAKLKGEFRSGKRSFLIQNIQNDIERATLQTNGFFCMQVLKL